MGELARALQVNCCFPPALGEVCENGLEGVVCGPFCQFSTPQRALTALLWIGAHGHTASCQRWLSLTAGASGLPHR